MNLEFLVTRSIYENPDISQRVMAKDFSVSLGKINAVAKSAEEKGFLIQNKKKTSYLLTEKGKEEVEKHKVDGAIILACGMGIRLAPLTYDTPKSFLKIKNERMIERQIEQLKAAGISDITIMVGYLKEKFDYLIDKYEVKLIYNEEYKTKNTLSTFIHAIDAMENKNMYICVSDVYMTKNIYHKYECEPYYIGAYYRDCKNEWRYIVNSKNEIKAVEVGGTNDYCLVGPCFLTKEFLDKFIPLAKEYYAKSSTSNFYWEDVLVRNFKNLPTIYLYKLDEDVIFEFDSIEDIKSFDSNIEEYGSEAITFVSKALDIKEKDIKDVECIKKGMTNHSYKFSHNKETFFARIPGEGTENYINRKNEVEVLNQLRDKNITEDIIFIDKNSGYKISKYFDDARPININDKNELKECMALYKRFHTLDIKVKETCDIIKKIEEYLNYIKEKEIYIPYEDFDKVMSNAKKIEKDLLKIKRPITICHGDPNPDNVLVTKEGLKMIDFEYAGMGDPLSDIALFGVYVGYDIDKTYELYDMYKDVVFDYPNESDIYNILEEIIPKDNKLAKKLLLSYMSLGGLYNAIWAIARSAEDGADYGTFGMRGYRTFKNCFSKL